METKEIKEFLEDLKENNFLKLKRSIGVGIYLFNKLKDIAPSYLLDNLKSMDKYPVEKKIAIVNDLLKFLKDFEHLQKIKRSKEEVEKKPISRFFKKLSEFKIKERDIKLLNSLGINTLIDALYYIPTRYEDKKLNSSIKTAIPGEKIALKVRVENASPVREGKYTAQITVSDDTGKMKLYFRYKNTNFIYNFKRGMEIVVFGKVKSFKGEKYMVHPEIKKPEAEDIDRIVPIYYARVRGELQSIPSSTKQKRLRSILGNIVSKTAKYLPEILPDEIVERYDFPSLAESIETLHLPEYISVKDLNEFKTPFQERLIYEDLFLFQLALMFRKLKLKHLKAPSINVDKEEFINKFEESLPFKLTNAQRRVIGEILKDLESETPMNRLLQGDVGSGKTVVATAVAYATVTRGFQVAVMVPTEILAFQHFNSFKNLLKGKNVNITLLTGSLTQAHKKSIYRHIKEGNIDIVIGTHALIQDKVSFKSLGLVIIDEQHRFGVTQKKMLLEKSNGLFPHCLVMSATPIPRTLALSIYGDLDISIIDELPVKNKDIETKIFYDTEKSKIIKIIREHLAKGNKGYIIYPLIEESEKIDLKSAVEGYEEWKKIFPDKRILLLHGKMNDLEKRRIMEEFKEEGDILVSTTVIEVGIDVPEATFMVIKDAHRFGLSQLHQLRGRIGRAGGKSVCMLVVPEDIRFKDSDALKRLRVMVKTNDGFVIAEEDLKIRGPGELLGVSQSGYFGFLIANLARRRDREMLIKAREDAERIVDKYPNLSQLKDLKDLLLYRYGDKMDLSGIA